MGGLGSLGANAASLAGGIAQRTTSRGGSTQIAQVAEKSIFANSSETQASQSNNSQLPRGAEPGSGTDPTEFGNPVNINRLIRTVTWHVSEPDGAEPLRLEIETDQAGVYRAATIIAHGYGGQVRVRYGDDVSEVWFDLHLDLYIGAT